MVIVPKLIVLKLRISLIRGSGVNLCEVRGNKFVGTEGWVSVDDMGNVTASSKAIMQKVNVMQKGYAYMTGHLRG